jgi:hypothetical protein
MKLWNLVFRVRIHTIAQAYQVLEGLERKHPGAEGCTTRLQSGDGYGRGKWLAPK